MLLELLVQVLADSDVLKHPLQFGRVLEATRLLHRKHKMAGGAIRTSAMLPAEGI